MDTTGKLCAAVSVSASVTGFPTTQTTGTPISVTTGGVTGTLPAGTVVVASNVGTTNAAYCKLGASATTSDQYIAPSGGWFAFTVGAATQLTCITSTSTTTVNMVGGSGLPTGTGGGSGGGAAITNYALETGGNLAAVLAAVQAAVPAGTNLIGYTSGDPCAQQNVAKVNTPISMQNTTTVKLVALASAKKIYICSLSLIASGATVFSIADGTKVSTECDTAAEAVIGATVASHGLSLAANGGISYGNGTGTVAFTTTAAHDLCLFQSGSVDLSGNITTVQQ